MRYKPAPRLDYHHIQPRPIIPPPHYRGEINTLAARELRKLPQTPRPQRPRSRRCIIFNLIIGPEPEPEPEPEPITVPTPYGVITIDPTPRSPLEETAHLMPIIAITQAVARPRAGGGLRHMVRCWLNNLFGGA